MLCWLPWILLLLSVSTSRYSPLLPFWNLLLLQARGTLALKSAIDDIEEERVLGPMRTPLSKAGDGAPPCRGWGKVPERRREGDAKGKCEGENGGYEG